MEATPLQPALPPEVTQYCHKAATTAENEVADQEKRDLVEAINKLDSEIYQIENMLNENRDKLPEQMVAEFDNMLIDAKAARDSGDKAKIDESSTKLSSLMQQLAQAAQGQAAQDPGAGAAADAATSAQDDDVIDVEFED